MTERLEIFSGERLEELGESGYQYYESLAQTSLVPPYFLDVAKEYLYHLPEVRELSPVEVAKLLFNTTFESEREAWIAINYAQAVAVVKQASDDQNDRVGSKELLIGVGVATLLENNLEDDRVEVVKEIVEDIFADPREALRVAQMYEDLKINPPLN